MYNVVSQWDEKAGQADGHLCLSMCGPWGHGEWWKVIIIDLIGNLMVLWSRRLSCLNFRLCARCFIVVMSLEFRHPPFSPFIAFLALPQYCLLSPTTTAPCNLLRSHRVTSACLWLHLHRLETLIGYTPMHRTTIPVLAHIKLCHFHIYWTRIHQMISTATPLYW